MQQILQLHILPVHQKLGLGFMKVMVNGGTDMQMGHIPKMLGNTLTENGITLISTVGCKQDG